VTERDGPFQCIQISQSLTSPAQSAARYDHLMGFNMSIDLVSPAPPVAPEQTSTSGNERRGSRSPPRRAQSPPRPETPETPPVEPVATDGFHVDRLA